MRRYNPPYNGKQYLLNQNTKEVHNLDNEKTECQINEIKSDHIKMFDDVNAALNYPNTYTRMNDGCKHCLSQYHTK